MLSSTSPELVPSSSPPRSLCAIVESSLEPPHHHSWPLPRPLCAVIFPTWVSDAIDHADLIPKSTTLFLSLQQHHHPRAHDIVHPTPFSSPRHWWPAPSSSHNTIILPEPVTSRARNTIEPVSSLSQQCHHAPPSPQGYIVYFSLSFWANKSWFWYATLPHCFDMLYCFCSAALL
jgi:hypothetical protein